MKDVERTLRIIGRVAHILLAIALTALVSIVSYKWTIDAAAKAAPSLKIDQLTALLFGAASLALFIFSILIAAWAAVFGWHTVHGVVREAVDKHVGEKVKSLENEFKGRLLSILGYLIGEMSIDVQLNPKLTDRPRLKEALRLCQEGYTFLARVGGSGEFMALNNLIYYECISGDSERGEFLLEKGRELKRLGLAHKATNLQLTGCRAILQYSNRPEEQREAVALLTRLTSDPQFGREAEIHLASIRAAAEGGGQDQAAPRRGQRSRR